MSVKNFKFVSPGVFINEIDNSQLPKVAPPVGPVVIGRAEKGPALLPTRVDSFAEFVDGFGLCRRFNDDNVHNLHTHFIGSTKLCLISIKNF